MNVSDLRILVVDSNPGSILLWRQVFGILNVKALMVITDGDAAIDQLYLDRYSAVLCSDQIKCSSGETFAHMARRSPGILAPMVPIFLVTGKPRRRDIERARDLGYTDVIALPVSAGTVVRKLQGALGKPRPFIAAGEFFGPDRRSGVRPPFRGSDRRTRSPRKVRVSVPSEA
ncbi:MAG: response regulator [Alphaproteobacteria bacterium]|nr:response regulator [Alphaproteobacteria bacterium]